MPSVSILVHALEIKLVCSNMRLRVKRLSKITIIQKTENKEDIKTLNNIKVNSAYSKYLKLGI